MPTKKEAKKETKTTKTTKKVAKTPAKKETKVKSTPKKAEKKVDKKVDKTVKETKTIKKTISASKTKSKKVAETPIKKEKVKVSTPKKENLSSIVTSDNRIDKTKTILNPKDDTKESVNPKPVSTDSDAALKAVGTASDEVKTARYNKSKEKDSATIAFNELKKGKITRQLFCGYVQSIEIEEKYNTFAFIVDYNGVKVMIPEKAWWFDNFFFGNSYYKKKIKTTNGSYEVVNTTEKDRLNIRLSISQNFIGALTYFTCKGENFERVNGFKQYYAVGDRLEACSILQDIFFFHKNRREDNPYPPREVTIGTKVEARVIGVKEDSVLVESCGVETRLDAYSITDEIINNCQDKYIPGDELELYVHKLEILDGKIKMSLSGRNRDPKVLEAKINMMKVKSFFEGHVVSINDKNERTIYTVRLSNGVRCTVYGDRVVGYYDLDFNDIVRVQIYAKYPDHVEGTAVRVRHSF